MSDHPRVCGEKCNPGFKGQGGRGITPAYAGKSFPTGCNSSLAQDHPRVCGEKVGPVGCVSGWQGSPPRVRGKDTRSKSAYNSAGITPACAGKRTRRLQMRQDERDHPRVCGEKRSLSHHRGGLLGSPPRVRGKATQQRPGVRRRRITPACAGKSVRAAAGVRWCRDHPRVCGEKLAVSRMSLP